MQNLQEDKKNAVIDVTDEFVVIKDYIVSNFPSAKIAIIDFGKESEMRFTMDGVIISDLSTFIHTFNKIDLVILSFPITTQSNALDGLKEVLYGKEIINLGDNIMIKNLFILDKVCNVTRDWIRTMPKIKTMCLQDMPFPNENCEDYMLIHWKNISSLKLKD